jgi:hypothetical protein
LDFSALVFNLTAPPTLFFFLGGLATLVRSDLEIPQTTARFLSLYLLMSIGLKGGMELSHSGVTPRVLTVMAAAVGMAVAVPLASFGLLRRYFPGPDAAALAATYGSISAVTFVTAAAFLDAQGMAYGGYMVAAMALMESPAIIVGVMLNQRQAAEGTRTEWRPLLRDAFLNGSVALILGSLAIGLLAADRVEAQLSFFIDDLFKGFLCFFLLDMGLVAAKRIEVVRRYGGPVLGFAIGLPLAAGLSSVALAWLLDFTPGDAVLFALLGGSASYIAVPAAMRLAAPDANPSLYIPMALGLTFPFNVILGIPLYYSLVTQIW